MGGAYGVLRDVIGVRGVAGADWVDDGWTARDGSGEKGGGGGGDDERGGDGS